MWRFLKPGPGAGTFIYLWCCAFGGFSYHLTVKTAGDVFMAKLARYLRGYGSKNSIGNSQIFLLDSVKLFTGTINLVSFNS